MYYITGMRRLLLQEPVSRPAIWAPAVAWFSFAVAAMAVLLIRYRYVDYDSGFAVVRLALAAAILAVLLALLAFMRIWQEGRRGLFSAVTGLLVAMMVLAYPGWLAARAVTLPDLNDVTTDTDNPPAFSLSRTALTARDNHIPPDRPPEVRRAQREAYQQLVPLNLDFPPNEAFELVRKAAQNLGWEIVETVKPGGRVGIGRLEAVDRTFLLRLPDDITVRLRPRADGTRIDVRSVSRAVGHDFGTNAARIREFLTEVSNLADTAA